MNISRFNQRHRQQRGQYWARAKNDKWHPDNFDEDNVGGDDGANLIAKQTHRRPQRADWGGVDLGDVDIDETVNGRNAEFADKTQITTGFLNYIIEMLQIVFYVGIPWFNAEYSSSPSP